MDKQGSSLGWCRFLIGFSVVMLSCQHHADAANVEDFIDFSRTSLPGRLFVPPTTMEAAEPRPLILFLHGAGETGSNNLSQINGNIDNLLSSAKQNDAFLYAPQAINFGWSTTSRTSAVMAMVDRAIDDFNVDTNRLYVTGLSMGGGGTWNMLNRYSDRFAAGVPIAGINPAGDFDPTNFLELPTWAFHARNDNVVSKNASRNPINRILDAANEDRPTYPTSRDFTTTLEFQSSTLDLNYTEWPTGGHGIWNRVYSQRNMYDWLYSQSTAIPEPATATLMAIAMTPLLCRKRRQL